MKKAALIPSLFLLLSLSGCGSSGEENTLFTSFYPIYDFASKLAGDFLAIENITPTGMEPHDFEPSARLIGRLEEGKGLLVNGLGLESYVPSLPEKAKAKTVEVSEGIRTIKVGNVVDPHIWLDPLRAKEEARNIFNYLCKIDGEHNGIYKTRLATLSARFDKLDADFKAVSATFVKHKIVTSHAAFGYLCDAYGLEQISIRGLEPGEEPSPASIASIIDVIKQEGVSTIFTEELLSQEIAMKISEETGAKIETLNPLEGLTKEEEGKEDYFSLMEENMRKIVEACHG